MVKIGGVRSEGHDLRASISPARHTFVGPMLAVTMEQYCALLLTLSVGRASMSERETSPQGRGSVVSVSNL